MFLKLKASISAVHVVDPLSLLIVAIPLVARHKTVAGEVGVDGEIVLATTEPEPEPGPGPDPATTQHQRAVAGSLFLV